MAGNQRKSLLQLAVEQFGTEGKNKNYIDHALANGGGFGATAGGIETDENGYQSIKPYNSDGSRGGRKVVDRVYNQPGSPTVTIDDANKWFEDAFNLFQSMNSYADSNRDKYNRDYGSSYNSQIADIMASAKGVEDYLNSHRNEIGNYSELFGTLEEYQEALKQYDISNASVRDYYSQWEDEDQYSYWLEGNTMWQSNQQQGVSGKEWAISATSNYEKATEHLNALQSKYKALEAHYSGSAQVYVDGIYMGVDNSRQAENAAELATLKQEIEAAKQRQLEAQKELAFATAYRYSEYSDRPDFDKKSAEGLAAFEAEKPAKSNISSSMFTDTTMGGAGFTIVQDNLRNDTTYKEPSEKWTEEQKKLWGYLKATDAEEADTYAIQLNDAYSREARKADEEKIAAWSTKNDFNAELATAGSILATPFHGVEYLADVMEYNARGVITEKSYVGAADFSNTVTGAIAENLNTKYGTLDDGIAIVGGKGWGDAYQLATSVLQSTATVMAAGPYGSLAVFFGTAAKSGLDDALERGATPEQALWVGFAQGCAEVLMEKISVEGLTDLLKKGASKSIIIDLLKQGGIEASEEMFTSIANNITDGLIMGDKSTLNATINKYMTEDGLSFEEAQKKAYLEQIEAVAFDTIGGFVSGIGGGATTAGVGSVVNHVTNYQGDSAALLNTAKESGNEELMKLAEEMAGKRMSNARAAKLLEGMTTADVQTIAKAAEGQLQSLGEQGDLALLSSAIAKTAVNTAEKQNKMEMSQHISRAEENALKKSKYGQQVLNELNAENILKGKDESGWTGSLNTMRVNPELYGRDKTIAKINEEIAKKSAIQTPPMKVEEVKPTGNETVDAIINKAYGKELSGNDVRPILGSAEAVEALETVVGSLDLKGKSSSEQRLIVQEAITKYAAENPIAVSGSKAVPSSVEAVASKYGKQAGAVKSIYNISPVENVDSFAAAFDVAYTIGLEGGYESTALESASTQAMSEIQRRLAYFTGKSVRAANRINGVKRSNAGRGLVRSRSLKSEDINKRFKRGSNQKTALQVLRSISEATGFIIEVFDSEGDYSLEQGSFDWDSDVVAIDIASGICKAEDVEEFAKYAMLRTFCHEFTHVGEKWAAEEYNILRTAVIEALSGRADFDLEGRIADIQKYDYEAKKARYIAQGMDETAAAEKAEAEKMSWDMASREVIAEAMTDVLPESRFMQALYEKTPSLASRLKEALRRFIARVKSYYDELVSNPSREAQALKVEAGGVVKYLEGIVEKWDAMALAAVENYQNAELVPGKEGTITNEAGELVAHSTKDGTVQLSMRTYEEDGRTALRRYLEKCVSRNQLTKAEMQEMLDGIEDIYNVCKEFKDKYAPFSSWSDAAVVRNTYGKPVFSVVTPNGDYKMNLDFSLVCKKRRALDAVFNEMSRRGIIDDFELGQKSVVKINEIIRKHGFETACALCFVDAKRFRQASMADQFVSLYNELVKSLVPEDQKGSIGHFNFARYEKIENVENGIDTWPDSKLDFSHINHVMKTYESGTVEYKAAKYIKSHAEGRKLLLRGDFMSSQGFDAVKTQNQNILKLYNSKKGTGGPKAAFGDVQYMNEIIQKARWWTPAKAYAVGGVRIQSFSDYVPRMVFDYVQMIYDLAATKLPAHAYTKEALFVKQFGLTGVKINMSLIPAIAKNGIAPGLDANGDYVWAGESFDFETAKQIQNAEGYSENCGTICVGVSKQHILKLLSDPDIRMVIPYHKSGLNPIVAHMNKIAAFTDYTDFQRTKGADGKAIDKDFDFNKALHELGDKGDPKAVAKQYLDWCAANGYTPKFEEFAWHENYYKLLEDFTVYDKDGKYVPQREVRAVFPKTENAFGSMKELIQEGLQEDAVIQGKRDKSLSSIVDEIEKSLPKTEAEIEETEVEQADRDVEAIAMTVKQFRLRSDNEIELENIKNGTKAIDKLINDAKTADNPNQLIVTNAMYRSDIGYIDFRWGEPGRGPNFKGGYGLSHIIAKRDSENSNGIETVYKIVEVIAKATHTDVQGNDYTQPQNMRLRLFYDGYVAVFVRGENGNHWLLTGWENDKETAAYAVGEGYDSSNATAAKPTPTRLDGVNATVSSNEMIAPDEANSQEQFSNTSQVQKQRRTPSYTDREVLEIAADSMSQLQLTEGERSALDIFGKRLDHLKDLEHQRDEQRQRLAELNSAAKPNEDEIRKTRSRLSTLSRRIKAAENQVLSTEDKQVLKKVLHKARRVVETEQRNVTRENRNTTAMRHKIKDIVTELNNYLLKGTKDKHVKIGLQKAVAAALDAVNMDTVGAEERIAKLNEELIKAKTPEKIMEITRRIERVQAMGDKMSERLAKLKAAYADIKDSDDPLIANSHDEVIERKIEYVMKLAGETPLRNMSLEQLEEVYELYKMVLTRVRDSNKAFKDAKKRSIDMLASNTQVEVEDVGGRKKHLKIFDGVSRFLWNNFKPIYAFKAIGSKTLGGLFDNVRAGEDVWAKDVSEARVFFLEQSKKHGYDSWDMKKTYTFTSITGMDFKLNLEQIMSLYAYSKRKQAEDHLQYGGIVFEDSFEKKKLFGKFEINLKTEDATAYNISPETMNEIIAILESVPGAKTFVDAMQDYLSATMGEKGNEVSLEMYGVKLFKEKFYFPLKSSTAYMARAREQAQGEVKIKNSGFTKETNPHAKNPIVLESFLDVWANHVNDMSMYHAFTLPLEDFYRVFNYKTPNTDPKLPAEGVVPAIQNAYGKGATAYIEQLLRDLNGGARSDPTAGFINKMMGLFKKGAVFASASVVIQQPSAIARAMALIDSKYFAGKKLDSKRHKALWEEVKQYAPIAIIKEMGYFDTNVGKSTVDFIKAKEYDSWGDKMKGLVTDGGYRDEVLSKAPALADELAWCAIWEAVKRETAAKRPQLAVSSEEFLKAAGERFTEVIVNTQVYDSVLSRSANMRSKDTGMKMATAFLAEPTTSINMIVDALIQGKRGNRKYARAAIGAVVASQILNAILVSFVYAGRDDDEDETYWEKYLASLTAEIKDSFNLFSYIPFIKDIVSIVQGYDVERSDIAVISDLWRAYEQLDSDKLSPWRKVENFAGSIAQLFGLPIKNIMRDARGLYQTVMSFLGDNRTTKAGVGYAIKGAFTGETVSDRQQLYEAIMAGDTAHAERVKARFEDQAAIDSAIRKALRENDPRIHEAAVARYNGDIAEYTRIAKEIVAEGHFSQDYVVTAINTEMNTLKPESEASSSKSVGLYTDDDYFTAVVAGDTATAEIVKEGLIAADVAKGELKSTAEDSVESSFVTNVKESYLEGNLTAANVRTLLTKYGDKSEEEAKSKVAEWDFEAKYGYSWSNRDNAYRLGAVSQEQLIEATMTVKDMDRYTATYEVQYMDFQLKYPQYNDLTKDQYKGYYATVERAGTSPAQAGIDVGVYAGYILDTKGIVGVDADGDGETDKNSLKNQILPIIDSLPITSEQKDILYLQRWSQSGLRKAPWH